MEIISVVLLVLILIAVILVYLKTGSNNNNSIEDIKNRVQELSLRLESIERNAKADSALAREEQNKSAKELRTELSGTMVELGKMLTESLIKQSNQQNVRLESFEKKMTEFTGIIDAKAEQIRVTVERQMAAFTDVLNSSFAAQKEEQGNNYGRFAGLMQEQSKTMTQSLALFRDEIGKMSVGINESMTKIREAVEMRLDSLSRTNTEKLEQMRQTVDEKLQSSIEKRFNESFKLISERLEQVHKGLGEMQTIASGVEDLKNVFKNVKQRGIIGEAQLGSLLEQYLAPDQYIVNAQIKKGSGERVEFAVKLPGQNSETPVLLSIDAKFPIEDYNKIVAVTATPGFQQQELETVLKQFETSIKNRAKEISEKYISVPDTVDFALMFIPGESIYAEILRRPGLFEMIQRDYRVTVLGPVNLTAFLSSLQMGFRTLAIQKRSSEVWKTLGLVKGEFAKFGDVINKTKEKLEQAVKSIDGVGQRTRAIERSLKNVETIPIAGAELLPEAEGDDE